MKVRLFMLVTLTLSLVLFWGVKIAPVAAQEPTPTETPIPVATASPPDLSLPIPNDIMPPIERGEQAQTDLSIAASDYKVIPIWFVPNDLTPNSLALPYIDNHMQLIQRWYGEQMRDVTFSLEPTRMVVGTQPQSYYYGPCFPPTSAPTCNWAYDLFFRTFDDLSTLGYPYQPNRVLEIFIQHDGIGGAGLGGGNRALIDLNRNNTFGDCLYVGCGFRVNDEGGAAHELGHAFGLDHTLPDSENSDSRSLMFVGFYSFPKANLANTSINPERDLLRTSPFFNLPLTLKNGGFEHVDCLFAWRDVARAASCTTTEQRSGLSALQLLPHNGQVYTVSQRITTTVGQIYDFSGWLNIPPSTSTQADPSKMLGMAAADKYASVTNLQLQVQALSVSGTVLSTFNVGNYTSTTAGWERFGLSMTMPSSATNARVQIIAPGFGPPLYIDDLDFHPVQIAPPAPSPVFYTQDSAVPTLHPMLQWNEVPAATTFRIQVATDSDFNTLITDAVVSSPFYTVPNGLAYDRRYFWRVRANNGAGQSNWSVTWSFVPRSTNNYHNEEFEIPTLASAWSWVREDPSHWGFGGPLNRRGYGYLGITTQAGDLSQGLNNAKNLLLRNSPPGDFEVSMSVEFYEPLNTNYQQGGLFIYQDDDNYIKLVRIYSDSFRLQIQAEVSGTIVMDDSTPINSPVLIKIARLGNSAIPFLPNAG